MTTPQVAAILALEQRLKNGPPIVWSSAEAYERIARDAIALCKRIEADTLERTTSAALFAELQRRGLITITEA